MCATPGAQGTIHALGAGSESSGGSDVSWSLPDASFALIFLFPEAFATGRSDRARGAARPQEAQQEIDRETDFWLRELVRGRAKPLVSGARASVGPAPPDCPRRGWEAHRTAW